MNVILIVAVLVGIYFLYSRMTKIPKIEALEKEKAPLVEKVDRLKEERETLKDKATVQEKDATEEHKEEFWEEYMGKKKDDK